MLHPNFLAIDFETANQKSTSACAIGLVRSEEGKIVQEFVSLIRPPELWFMFTDIHGITAKDVINSPTFGELWPSIQHLFNDIDFLVAHNAPFDARVLNACCDHYGISAPSIPFHCTVKLARSAFSIFPTKLSNVCAVLDIPLNHHEALSDARACAQIVLRARGKGSWIPFVSNLN